MEIREIEFENKEYPNILRIIKKPPKKLYVLGNGELLRSNGIAIVGSRNCTDEGIRNARVFSANIANAGFTVISGMAKGIDAAAHMGALEVNGKTIAVLGNGPKFIYPPENEELYYKILERGGAIISEYSNDTPPDSDKFRQRNRIVSGLSLGVLIVEAEYRSGTSITARFAKEQARDVFCIPNSRENSKGIGTNILIQKGAKLVLQPKEIIEKYVKYKIDQISIEELEKDKEMQEVDLSNIKKDYREIYIILTEELTINEISVKTKIEVSELYQKLFMMELEGLIECHQNKYRISSK